MCAINKDDDIQKVSELYKNFLDDVDNRIYK